MNNVKKHLIGALLLVGLIPSSSWLASERLEAALNMDIQEQETEVSEDLLDTSQNKYWTCPGCSDVENKVLKALQDQGITDKVALAVLMGNIRQESKFETTICEGGQKTGYHHCHRGGFGLIQWTTQGRYNGLGRVAREYQLDPNSLDAQLKWLFAEVEWQKVEHKFKAKGQPMSYYMNAAYKWLGWGVEGARTQYAQKYLSYLHQK